MDAPVYSHMRCSLRQQTKTIVAAKSVGAKADFIVYADTNHGFAVRGDESTDAQRKQCQRDVVAFFQATLS